jgi:hypothetical protein
MQFKPGTPLYAYEKKREGGEDVLYFYYIALLLSNLAEQAE